jgi:hypothetical protein
MEQSINCRGNELPFRLSHLEGHRMAAAGESSTGFRSPEKRPPPKIDECSSFYCGSQEFARD